MSKFQLKSIKTHGGDRKNVFLRKMHFCEKWQFFAKNGQNFAEFGENLDFLAISYHHWHGFSEIMTQKVQKSAHFRPQIS